MEGLRAEQPKAHRPVKGLSMKCIWSDSKKRPRNIYAYSEEECEKLLAEIIVEIQAEIAAEKAQLKAG